MLFSLPSARVRAVAVMFSSPNDKIEINVNLLSMTTNFKNSLRKHAVKKSKVLEFPFKNACKMAVSQSFILAFVLFSFCLEFPYMVKE